ncbi:MAG: hypothetical protein Q7T32_06365 [Moraxellaceae bacterium]|nr:hypothetical protein [Moraxellaceae bacterium]
MRVQIKSVAGKGIPEKERLVLRVLLDTNIGDFVVMRTGYGANGVTIDVTNTYWFPYKEVSAGDLIILYTKAGKDSEKDIEDGKKAHFFYWEIEGSIWNTATKAPVLLYAPEWEMKAPGDL